MVCKGNIGFGITFENWFLGQNLKIIIPFIVQFLCHSGAECPVFFHNFRFFYFFEYFFSRFSIFYRLYIQGYYYKSLNPTSIYSPVFHV